MVAVIHTILHLNFLYFEKHPTLVYEKLLKLHNILWILHNLFNQSPTEGH